MLEGTPAVAFHLPAQHTTPAGKGRALRVVEEAGSAATARGRGKAGGRIPREDEQQGPGSGTETDASDDVSHARSPARSVLVLDAGATSAGGLSGQEARQGRRQQQVQQDGGEPAPGQGVGRKRRQPEHEQGQAARLSPPRKRRQQGAATAATPPEQLALLDAAAGWHTVQHRQGGMGQEEAGSPGSRPPSAAPQVAASTGAAKRQAPGARRSRKAVTPAREGHVQPEAPGGSSQQTAAVQKSDGEEEGEDEGAAAVTYLPLLVSRQLPVQRTADDGGPANFKAFRKRGGGVAAAAAMTRPLIAFDDQPYAEEGPLNGDAFVR